MLPPERHSLILERLAEHGSVRTIELATALAVTDETVRKDLELLEKRGELARIHGGATRIERPRIEPTLTERQMLNREAKMAIAKAAAARIQPNETIFLDSSSTALFITDYLPDFPITILTNAHNVVTALSDREGDIFCTGGLYEQRSKSYIGLPAEAALRKYNIHRMFFSCSAVDLERGPSEANSRQASFKERVIECSEEVCLLADATKLGRRSAFFYTGLDRIDTLVTDNGAEKAFVEKMAALGVATVVAE